MNRTRTHTPASGRPAFSARRRHAAWLRHLSLLLALCCFWSFAGAGVAVAAMPPKDKATDKAAPHPFPHTPAFHAPLSSFGAAPPRLRSAPAWKLTQATPLAWPHATRPSDTLLDEVGRLAPGVSLAQVWAWKQELAAHPAATRAARLHLWLGEWQLAHDQQPLQARHQFRQARALAHQAAGRPSEKAAAKRLYGLAVYDSAVALYYEGAYRDAADAFLPLCQPKTLLSGYDVRTATLWWRHAGACAGYHAERAALGIPEPPRLDPLCGVAAVAASLRSFSLPFDKKTLLHACRVTGEGSTFDDLLASGKKLGVSIQAVTADEQGLRALPKPLVAYVEHDHFISVVRADRQGVSYLCSDCGAWPGGRVDLTWKQWRALEPGLYAVVTKPGSVWNRSLAAALNNSPGPAHPTVRVASVGSLAGLGASALRVHLPLADMLRGHVVRTVTVGVTCGVRTCSQHCTSYNECWLVCDPVNLATLEEEYAPLPDLTVYNPHGPGFQWKRIYNSLRRDDGSYQEDDFGGQWSQPYNVEVYDPSVSLSASNQILTATSTSFSSTGTAAPGAGLTWDVLLNGSMVASSASPAGWSVSFSGYSPGTFTLTAPAGATLASGYTVRYSNGSYGTPSATFSVVSALVVPQGGSLQVPANGTDAPAAGLSWDILKNGVTVATSAQPNCWQVSASYGSSPLTIQASLNAAIGSGYEVRFSGYGIHSAVFSVGATRFAPATGSGAQKYVVEPNGARTWFTAPATPTAANSKVSCTVQAGAPLLVEWDYDAGSSAGHYTITWQNRTKWVTGTPAREIVTSGSSSYGLVYSLAQLVDRSGNALNFTYGYLNPADQWPLLTGIADANTGATLLTLNRDTTGFVTSVSDAYGRSVVYGKDGTTGRLSQVSQIVPAGSSSPPARYTYGYQMVAADDERDTFPFLHTITVPSATGSGTSMTTINYSTDDAAAVTSIQDGNGNTTGFSVVDANHTQVTVKNAGGSQVYSYIGGFDGNLNKTSLTDGLGQVISQYVYSGANPYRPTTVYDGVAYARGFTQVPQGGSLSLPITGTDGPAAPSWDIVNAAHTIVATSSAPGGWNVTYNSGSLTVSAPSGAVTGSGYEVRDQSGYTWSAYFSVVAPGAPARPPASFTWDTYGNLLTRTSPRGTTTTYTYSYTNFGLGELTQAQEGTKSPTSYAYYEPSGLVQTVTGPLPGTVGSASTVATSYTYDTTSQGSHGLGNLLTVTAPGNNAASTITTTFNYTQDGSYSQPAAMGQPLTVTNNLGKVTHLRYDAQGNAVAVKDALGNETDLTYDIRNAPLQTILPATGQTGSGHGGSQIGYLYAEPSALATTQWPAVTLQYGPAATQTTYDEGNVGAVRQVVSTYGLEGELKQVTGSTEPVAYAYDGLYRLKTLTDAASHVTSYFYNAAGYPYQTVYPGASSTPPTAPLAAGSLDTLTYPGYDADGNLLSRTDGNNKTTSYTYSDPESRLTGITYPAGTIGAVGLTYDNYGRRTGMSDGTGGQSFAYDDDNDLISKTVTWTGLAAKTVSYGFYNNGSRQSMNAAGNSFSYGYDGVGRLSSVTSPFSETTTYAYQDNGWLSTKTLANGDVTAYTRDGQGRLRDLLNKTGAGATLCDFAVPAVGGYDGAGNKLAVTATIPNCGASYSGTDHYTYDYGQTANPQLNRSQLTQESSSTLYTGTKVYNYDQPSYSGPGISTGPGNATHFDPYDLGYNADNQLTGQTYDGNGNPTTYKTNTLAFDPENRLTSYSTAQTDGYSADGLRAWKQTGAGTTRTYFLYDGTQPVGEYASTGTLSATNVFGADGLISRRTGGSSVFYAYDDRGNVSETLDASGNKFAVFGYDVWGNRTAPVNTTPGPWDMGAQYGYYTDTETGLSLLTHRFYDPVVGRFLTRDPIGYGGGINLYGYTQNSPVNRSDPSGYDDNDDPDKHVGTGDENINTPTTTGSNPENPGSGSGSPVSASPGPIPAGPSGGGGISSGPITISSTNDVYMPPESLPQQKVNGEDIPLPNPDANGAAHTTMGSRTGGDGNVYRQTATFPGGPTWPSANGQSVPWSRVDWCDHGRPWDHPDPHQHYFYLDKYGDWRSSRQSPFNP